MIYDKRDNKIKLGRPVTLNKQTVTKKCLDFYIDFGIDNKSFNEVIRYAGVSKGSIYRFYGSEDQLQKSALQEYFKSHVLVWLEGIQNKGFTIRSLIMEMTSGLITNKYKCCLFHRSKAEKYKLGPITRAYIDLVTRKIYDAIKGLILEEFKKKGRKLSKNEVQEVTNFLFSNLTNINLLKLNKVPHRTILNVSKALVKFIKNY